jgi:SAM-dependent methyltransferase
MKCRVSGEPLTELIDLGDLYLNDFPSAKDESLPTSPLTVGLGRESGLAQLYATPDQNALYREYWYRSGTNESMKESLREISQVAQFWRPLEQWDIVLDIGCNDGYMMTCFPDSTIKVGIDPAKNLRQEAAPRCDYHMADYFTYDNYHRLMGDKKAAIVTSIAMFYDLDAPRRFVRDVREVLADDGVWIIQMSYTPLMLEQNAFDNICHEHLEYYTLRSLEYLLEMEHMKIVDVELNYVNGGSFRVVVMKEEATPKVPRFVQDVAQMRYNSLYFRDLCYGQEQWEGFAERVETLKTDTLALLDELKGKKVYGYGASTKGNTLLQYYGIGPDRIRAIAERQPQKFGKFTAGSWIPIISDEDMRAESPDYLLVFPWHFIDNFIDREREFLRNGGRFIVPLPQLEVIDGAD